MTITKPTTQNGWLDKYIAEVPGDDLMNTFKTQTDEALRFFNGLSDEQLDYRYAEGKWNIREIIIHLMDAERVFLYRALRFARRDRTELPGFDENLWVNNSYAENRSLKSLLEEYIIVRTCTVATFVNFSADVLVEKGIANGTEMSVAALGFAIAGHERHHLEVIRQRYLVEVAS